MGWDQFWHDGLQIKFSHNYTIIIRRCGYSCVQQHAVKDDFNTLDLIVHLHSYHKWRKTVLMVTKQRAKMCILYFLQFRA